MMFILFLLSTVTSISTSFGGPISQHFQKEPEKVSATLGEQIRLRCDVKQIKGNCQWTKDGFGLGTDPDLTGFSRYSLNMLIENQCDLILDPVQSEDEGVYQCQIGAVQGVATITAKPVTLTVNHEPGLPHILQTKHGDVLEVFKGEEIILECESQGGIPAADIVWKHKDGTKITTEIVNLVTRMDDNRLFMTYSVIKFVPLRDEELVCTAFSDQFRAERVSNAVKIRLKHAPKIALKFSKENIGEGENIEVLCKAKAYPLNIRYTWFINNVEMLGEQKEVLKIENIKIDNDKMMIKCRAENSIGTTEESKQLILSVQPKIGKHPDCFW